MEVRVEEKQGDREEVDQEAAVRSFGEMQTEVDQVDADGSGPRMHKPRAMPEAGARQTASVRLSEYV